MQYGDYLYYEKVDEDDDGIYDYIRISDCDDSAETVDIPAEIDGLLVTSIGNFVFMNCENLTSIIIPGNVAFIGALAFANCKSLTNITIPEGVKTIIDETFRGCENLINITIPESVERIGYAVFTNCYSLESITIPENVTTIEDGTFGGCYNLTSINVSENNTVYSSENGVLLNKDKTKLICVPAGRMKNEFPESVTSIGNSAFFTCITLKSITLPEDITAIGYGAFNWCENLTSITIENPECEIADSAATICNGSVYVEETDEETWHYYYSSYYNGVIRGYENSTAQAYAEKYGYEFESLGEKPPVTTTEPISGDISGNGAIDLYDAIEIAKYMVGKRTFTEAEMKIADVNNDGVINLYDAIRIAEIMIENSKK
ncbi:MAG: leucine-rich repeat protein [Clostridium sp.]|nr:leucine-rich repeat protein [Clostridium sp.]MCM1548012.1 leucine-rich repeat protein [Ruminococcus sp.]